MESMYSHQARAGKLASHFKHHTYGRCSFFKERYFCHITIYHCEINRSSKRTIIVECPLLNGCKKKCTFDSTCRYNVGRIKPPLTLGAIDAITPDTIQLYHRSYCHQHLHISSPPRLRISLHRDRRHTRPSRNTPRRPPAALCYDLYWYTAVSRRAAGDITHGWHTHLRCNNTPTSSPARIWSIAPRTDDTPWQ